MSTVYLLRKPQIFKYRQKLLSVSQAKPLNLLIPQVPVSHTRNVILKVGVCVCVWNIRSSGSNETQAAHVKCEISAES